MASLARLGMQRCKRSLLQAMTRRLESSSAKTKLELKAENIEYKPPAKTWVSFGFSKYSEEIDRHLMHQTMFVGVTLCLVLGCYLLAYAPDNQLRDWAQREAYIQLRRREQLGLEPIDPNLIDPKRIKLPSDEELGDFEIVI